MKKILLAILFCFCLCNMIFAQGIGFNEKKVLQEYYIIKQRVDTNFSKNIYDVNLAEDLFRLLHNFDEGYYEKLPNADAEFEDVVYKNIVISFAKIKNCVEDEYSFFRDDSFSYTEENITNVLKEYIKKDKYQKLIQDINQVAAFYFLNNYFDDYRVADMFSKYYCEVLILTDSLNLTTEKILFNISKQNNKKSIAKYNAQTYGEILYKNAEYYKSYEYYCHYFQFYFDIAEIFKKQGNNKAAIIFYTKAIETIKNTELSKGYELSIVYLQRATCKMRLKDYQNALEDIIFAQKFYPPEGKKMKLDIYYLKSVSEMKLKDYDSAIKDVKKLKQLATEIGNIKYVKKADDLYNNIQKERNSKR